MSWRPAPRRAVSGVLLGVAVLGLAGCVYLRLLKVKGQLQDFDRHFSIGGRSELVIEFLHPVLTRKDAVYLIGADPLFQTPDGADTLAHYEFDMVLGSSASVHPPLHRLSLDLAFREDRLVKIIVPETFMLLFPRNMLVETLRQAKDAAVFETKRLARGEITLSPTIEPELPSLARTLFLLGEPLAVEPEAAVQTLFYRYGIVGSKRVVPIHARLSFDAHGLLRRVRVRWDTSAVEAVFIRE